MEFQGHQGRVAIFFGNKSPAPLTSLGTQVEQTSTLAVQSAPLASTLNPRTQLQQQLMVECLEAYGEPPQIQVRFVGPTGPTQHVLRLPIPASKFVSPLQIDGAEFFRRWKALDGKEAQQIFKLSAPLAEPSVERAAAGLGVAALKGVDPNPGNFVLAGSLATKGAAPQSDTGSVLMRLEVNANMCRASVRAAGAAPAMVMKLIISQLGAAGS